MLRQFFPVNAGAVPGTVQLQWVQSLLTGLKLMEKALSKLQKEMDMTTTADEVWQTL